MAKNVIIMGATSGIGEALAVRFAALGCDLAIAGRRADRLQAIASKISSEHNVRVIWSEIDVRREDARFHTSRLKSAVWISIFTQPESVTKMLSSIRRSK